MKEEFAVNLRKRVEALEQEKKEPEKDMIPGPEDIGRWVMVWNEDEPEKGPYILRGVEATSCAMYPFYASYSAWKRARIVPGPIRGTLQEHDGSPDKPGWLSDDDELIVEYEHGVKAIRFASVPSWNRVRKYQKMEIK